MGSEMCIRDSNGEVSLDKGIIGKIGSDGDSIWFRHIHPIPKDKVRSSQFYNLIATSDKHYLAAGTMFPSEAPDSVVTKIWLVKFDENGRIVGDSTSMIRPLVDYDISFYPNPTSDYLYIDHNDKAFLEYRLIDIQGSIVMESPMVTSATTFVLSLSHLPSAIYYLQVIDDGEVLESVPIVRI